MVESIVLHNMTLKLQISSLVKSRHKNRKISFSKVLEICLSDTKKIFYYCTLAIFKVSLLSMKNNFEIFDNCQFCFKLFYNVCESMSTNLWKETAHIAMIFLFHSVGAPELPIFFRGKLWILIGNPWESLIWHSNG